METCKMAAGVIWEALRRYAGVWSLSLGGAAQLEASPPHLPLLPTFRLACDI